MAIGLAFGILVAATLLFISGRLRPDLVALLVLMTLGATGIITQQEAFSGFSSSAFYRSTCATSSNSTTRTWPAGSSLRDSLKA